ncbi:MAG TPA: cupin domain-containing protein [Candidatus Cybelea sp.]|nr:cupin domain-containing protein [Candidatus Cybelea sp.]
MTHAIIRLGVNPPPAEEGRPAAVISGSPVTSAANYFTDATGQFFAGVWESTVGKWPIRYTESELCVILEGRVVLIDEAGRAEAFGKGDSFVIPSGFTGTWETVEPVKKLYAIFEAKS